jgi:hypothetical protein
MAAVQFMCAKLGMVTGCGLASVIRGRSTTRSTWKEDLEEDSEPDRGSVATEIRFAGP